MVEATSAAATAPGAGDPAASAAPAKTADSPQGPPDAAERSGGERPKPTKVQFRHKFFLTVKGGCFRHSAEDGSTGFAMVLGDNEVMLSLPGIRREFGIEEGTADGEMLALVEQGLNFVPELRIGDPLPQEILTGAASWEITERHRTIASQRVSLQLVTWISGEETLITDPDQLVQLAEDPRTRERINEAFEHAAEALGWGAGRKDDVVKLVGQLAEELAFIEAIREQYARVMAMAEKVGQFRRLYATDMSTLDEISSCERFLTIAIKDYGAKLEEIDAQTGEIMALLKNAASGIRFIREGRDDLRRRLMAWQEIMDAWEELAVKRSQTMEDLLRKSNRFLAPRFMPRDEWVLMSQLYHRREPTTARIW